MLNSKTKRLIWITPDALIDIMDSATWLETTRGLQDHGWDVTLLTGDKPSVDEINGIRVDAIGKPPIFLVSQVYFHLMAVLRIFSMWREADIVFFHAISVPWMLPLMVLRWLTFRRLPLFIMDTRTVPMTDMSVARLNDRIRMAYYDYVFVIATKLFDGQTAITMRLANAIGIPSSKLLCDWSSGVNLSRFSKQTALVEKEPNPACVKICYIGTLSYERSIHIFCNAITQAVDKGMNFKFSMVGSGNAFKILSELADASNGAIEIHPQVNYDKIPEILASNHIGVLPFPDEEKFRVSSPIKLFEYMAGGMPVLATRVVCHTDVIGHGKYVFWAEDATEESFLDTLHEIWDHREQLAPMGLAAQENAAKWDWPAIATRLSDSLDERINSVSKGGLRHESSHV